MIIKPSDINTTWRYMLYEIMHDGHEVSPRGKRTRELLGHHCILNMKKPVLTVTERKLGYRFMCASAAWILSGDNRVETIAPYSKTVSNFSDDGQIFFGAYGPKIYAQLDYAVNNLKADQDSRQAVINIWRENPPKVKDVPCTLSHQFLIRNGQLDVVTTMRSNDAWLGFPYDVFDVTMLAGYVLLKLGPPLQLGSLYHSAGSRHLYESDWEGVKKCIEGDQTPEFEYPPFDPFEFDSAGDLVEHLWALAELDKTKLKGTFLVNVR